MDQQLLTGVLIIIGIIFQLILLKWIISSAISSALTKSYSKEQRRQTLLLGKMAQKLGVSDEEVNKLINL